MKQYRRVFRKKHTLLVVVHAENTDQVLRNATIAFGEGADGIFLINHSIGHRDLFVCYEEVRKAYPDEWIGLNWLDLAPAGGLSLMSASMGGMWVDNLGVRADHCSKDQAAAEFARKRRLREQKIDSTFLLFGGVAFKGQEVVHDLAEAAKLAMPHADVITTSGTRTGCAPSVEKIRIMKQAVGDHPLAIASGITPENVQEYMPWADCFLVATGISDSHTELNPTLTGRLVTTLAP